eukprot:4424600-Prymnesium_polylepis.1
MKRRVSPVYTRRSQLSPNLKLVRDRDSLSLQSAPGSLSSHPDPPAARGAHDASPPPRFVQPATLPITVHAGTHLCGG